MADSRVKRVVVMVQENHTTDNYFRDLAPYGAQVLSYWPTKTTPPAKTVPQTAAAPEKVLYTQGQYDLLLKERLAQGGQDTPEIRNAVKEERIMAGSPGSTREPAPNSTPRRCSRFTPIWR